MVAAMVLGGLRRCEALRLRLADVRIWERRVFIAEGKGGHQRLVPVSPRPRAASPSPIRETTGPPAPSVAAGIRR
jgi:integrase